LANKNIYLIADYHARPKNPRLTAQPGYMSDPGNIQFDENLSIVRGFRDKYLKSHVVLDLTEERVIKNSFTPGKTFEELFKHFYEGFGEYIEQTVNDLNAALQIK
jgi:hypothetical protein